MNNLYLVTAPEMDLMVSAPKPNMALQFWASICRIWEVQHDPKSRGSISWRGRQLQLIGGIEE